MPARTLKQLAERACIKGLRGITDIGEIPYEMIRPVLLRIQSPEQLIQLETNCPQLLGEDAEIWREFIKRDIPSWESKPHEPSDPANWSKVYRKLKREAEKEEKQSALKLKAAYDSIKNEKDQKVAQIVSRAKLPARRPTSQQMASAKYYGIPSQIRRPGGSSGISNKKMAVPMHELKKRTTQIIKPPAGFVADQKRKADALRLQQARQSAPPPPPTALSRPPAGSYNTTQRTSTARPSQDLKDREARLRALTQGSHPPPASSSSDRTRSPVSSTSSPSSSKRPPLDRPPPSSTTSLLKRTLDTVSSSGSSTVQQSPSKKRRVTTGPASISRRNVDSSTTSRQRQPAVDSKPRAARHGDESDDGLDDLF